MLAISVFLLALVFSSALSPLLTTLLISTKSQITIALGGVNVAFWLNENIGMLTVTFLTLVPTATALGYSFKKKGKRHYELHARSLFGTLRISVLGVLFNSGTICLARWSKLRYPLRGAKFVALCALLILIAVQGMAQPTQLGMTSQVFAEPTQARVLSVVVSPGQTDMGLHALNSSMGTQLRPVPAVSNQSNIPVPEFSGVPAAIVAFAALAASVYLLKRRRK